MVDEHGCRCDCKKAALSAVVAAVLRGVGSFVIHHLILGPHYLRYSFMMNMDLMRSRQPAFSLAHLAWGAAFGTMYARGWEADRAPIGQGLRFGVLAWLIGTVSPAIIEYVVYPFSGKLIGGWIGLEFVECLLIGAVVASLYRPKTA